jgi:DNA repair exonuclease SbcCD ATPase subunit
MDEPRELATLKKQVIQHVYRSETTGMWANKSLKLYGRAEETAEDFLARCQAAARDVYDTKAAKLQLSFDKKLRRLEDRIRKKEARLVELRQTAKARQTDELLNAGETMLSWFTGRRRSLSSAASKRRMTATADAKVEQAELDIDQLGEEMDALRIELEDALQQLEDDAEARVGATEAREVRLEKNDIQVRAFGVLWVPVTRRI